MKTHNYTVKYTLSAVLLVGISIAGNAQDVETSAPDPADFSLFENLDSANNSASAAETARTNRSQGSRNTVATPTFVLVGTSRIGSVQSAMLKHMSGETIKVPLSEGVNPVPGHDLYSVLQHGAGQVAIRYPAAIPCADFPEQGVSCDSTTNISTISITTAEAVRVAASDVATQSSSEEQNEPVAAEEEAPNSAPRNPFAALRDRGDRAASTQAAPTGRFQPRRIDPADVPPGMRIVSTPFGDRLVNQ